MYSPGSCETLVTVCQTTGHRISEDCSLTLSLYFHYISCINFYARSRYTDFNEILLDCCILGYDAMQLKFTDVPVELPSSSGT
jgi:hypothetical protein